jgi:hypothetical protein
VNGKRTRVAVVGTGDWWGFHHARVTADSLGNANAKAEISARPDTGKVYSVAVKNDASAIIACGNFTKR